MLLTVNLMTKKSVAIENMLNGDPSGRLRRLHDQLVAVGLKTKMPPNSSTLLFEAVSSQGERIGLAALRDAGTDVFSFPRPYWVRHIGAMEQALSGIDHSQFVATDGAFSSSQYSARQVRISVTTIAELELVVAGLISQHCREIAGDASR